MEKKVITFKLSREEQDLIDSFKQAGEDRSDGLRRIFKYANIYREDRTDIIRELAEKMARYEIVIRELCDLDQIKKDERNRFIKRISDETRSFRNKKEYKAYIQTLKNE